MSWSPVPDDTDGALYWRTEYVNGAWSEPLLCRVEKSYLGTEYLVLWVDDPSTSQGHEQGCTFVQERCTYPTRWWRIRAPHLTPEYPPP